VSRFIVGVDIGGTFTDLVALDGTTGELRSCKVPSTPPGYIDGVVNALDRAGLRPGEVALFKHGCTIATNAIIQRTGARTALVTTDGFRDVLPAARAARVDLYDSDWDPSPPLVPRRHILTVPERLSYEGDVLVALDEEAVRRAGRILHRRGMESVAVSFLHSYVNPAHEARARELLEETCPGAYVYISSETIPEVREFERTSTTVVNAYLGPIMERYLGDLADRLLAWGYAGQILITHSGGGLMTCEAARRLPARICQSGPAGGVMGGAHLGRMAGFPNLVTLDIGGTSADMSLVYHGEPRVANEWRVEFNIPITFPAVDLIAIGAGGGSVAWVDPGGALRSGPQSAGAVPGPACYGQGGAEPTSTDANLVLGRLSPEMFLGGDMRVRPELARGAIHERVGRHFGFTVEEAAMSILRVANDSMMNAVRLISVQRGYDPRDFALLAFGGAGPLHAVELAQELEIPTVLVPRLPGLTSALGVLDVDLRYDYVRPLFQRARAGESEGKGEPFKGSPGINPEGKGEPAQGAPGINSARVQAAFDAMESEARAALLREGAAPEAIQLRRTADLRYYGQISASVSVALGPGAIDRTVVAEMLAAFLAQYRREYGYVMPRDIAEIEIVNARVSAQGIIHRREATRQTERGEAADAVKGQRPVYFQGDGFVTSTVYDRARLRWGASFSGPAIVEQWDSTTVVPPGAAVDVDEYLNLVIRVRPQPRAREERG
jgi:N-methylhydantoinase A